LTRWAAAIALPLVAAPGRRGVAHRPERPDASAVEENVEHGVVGRSGELTVTAGQVVHTAAGEWVRYSTPGADGAEYLAVCLPAFSPDTVHRDD
jgi:hypothetical protein